MFSGKKYKFSTTRFSQRLKEPKVTERDNNKIMIDIRNLLNIVMTQKRNFVAYHNCS